MQLREATRADAEEIRSVARESLAASYGDVLGQDVVDRAADQWYGDGLGDDIAADGSLYAVAVVDDEVVAFSQSYLSGPEDDIGEIHWLHVAPRERDTGLGTALLAFTEAELRRRDVGQFRGRVLAANELGTTFYEDHGYEPIDERDIEIHDEEFTEQVYGKQVTSSRGHESSLERRQLADGETVYVAFDEADRASKGPLYVVYHDRDRSEKRGWFCSACGSFEVAMEPMGRAECNECGNRRKPTRWDAAYL
jgi:GNAT superfamily N-acetyltransferase